MLELDPNDAQAHYNLARALIETGALEPGAKLHLRAAIAAWPEFFDAHLNLAILLGRSGRGEEAAEHIERAVAIDPEHVPTRMLHARVLAERGDQRAAMAELEAIVALDPASIDARWALAQLHLEARRGRRGEAPARAGARRRWPPAIAIARSAHLRLAAPAANATGRGRQLICARRSSSSRPRSKPAARWPSACASAGRLDEAAAELGRLVELAPDDPRARVGLATTLGAGGGVRAGARRRSMRAATASPTTSRSSTCSARLLATCPDPALRDGARAVTIAEKLVERELSVDHIETLAMALRRGRTLRRRDALAAPRDRATDRHRSEHRCRAVLASRSIRPAARRASRGTSR